MTSRFLGLVSIGTGAGRVASSDLAEMEELAGQDRSLRRNFSVTHTSVTIVVRRADRGLLTAPLRHRLKP